jgi:parallel beta-helix repeat protein
VDHFPLVESPLYFGEKIHIDDSGVNALNWSATARVKVWCTGSGTYSDPYILDGLEVDAGGLGSGILVENSMAYFIIRNCIVSNSGYVSPYYEAGIRLVNTNHGTLLNNYFSNNDFGIFVIGSDNEIAGNNIYGTTHATGIVVEGNNNIVEANSAENNWQGIYFLDYSHNNTISGNIANNNVNYGFVVYYESYNNTISGNIANNNPSGGIYLYYADNNTISGNMLNNNGYYGIRLSGYCDNNTIVGNTVYNNDYGVYVYYNSDNNTIVGNTVYNNDYGVYVYYNSDNNIIVGNIAYNNNYTGIYLYSNCDNNTIMGNTIIGNKQYGIELSTNCNNNTIVENVIHDNYEYGMTIDSSCSSNLIYLNEFKNQYNAKDDGNNQWDNGAIGNYWDDYEGVDANDDGIGDTPYNITGTANSQDNFPIWEDGIDLIFLFVEILDQVFSTESFNITFYIYNGINEGINFAVIQIWWNEVEVSSDIQNLGGGLYFIALDPITVAPGEDPILLNMSIFATGYPDKYFETYINVEAPEIVKYLQVEITDHSYSTEHFNLTFHVFDESGQGIDYSSFQIWWNGVDVSADVQNLGNGFYFISLDPITVSPGEDPILLNMIISAAGYEDKYFETYIAVDPASLQKGKAAEEFPLTLIIVLSAIIGGTIIGVVSLYWFRRRKKEPQF